MMKKRSFISIAIADDFCLVRNGLAVLLERLGDYKVLFQAGDGQELLNWMEKANPLPDICILDIKMQPLDGYRTTEIISHKYPGIHVLAVSMYDNDFSIVQMLRAGASGYLHKTAEPEELDCALQTLFTGGYYHTELESANPSNAFNISVREREFLTLCCRELVYKEIAAIMKVSIHTVNGYRDALFIKLNLHSRTALAIFALEVGIVTRSDLKEEQEPPW